MKKNICVAAILALPFVVWAADQPPVKAGTSTEQAAQTRSQRPMDDDSDAPEGLAEYLATLGDIPVGPFLTPTVDMGTSVGVVWLTTNSGAGIVEYGKDAVGESSARETEGRIEHYVLLKELKPGTRYKYRVKTGSVISPEYSFLTSPPDGKFKMAVFADSHFLAYKDKEYDLQRRSHACGYQRMLAFEPDVVLACGDDWNKALGGRRNVETPFINFMNANRDLFARAVILPTVGNHEWESPGRIEIFKKWFHLPPGDFQPQNGCGIAGNFEVYGAYWEQISKARPMPKSMEGINAAIHYGGVNFIIGRDLDPVWMAKFLDGTADRTRFSVVAVHYPLVYTDATRGICMKNSREWLDLLAKHPIDFVFTGHNHLFERTYPVRPNPYQPEAWGILASLDPRQYGDVRGATIYQQLGSMWFDGDIAIPDLYHVGQMNENNVKGRYTLMTFDGLKVKVETRGFTTSASVKDVLVDQYQVDRDFKESAPKIVEVPSVTPTAYEAAIRWRTDLPAKSMVLFGQESGKYSLKVPHEDTDQEWATEHGVTLNCLEPEKKYYFVVESDRAGRVIRSEEKNFTTGKPAPGMQVAAFDFGPVQHRSLRGSVKACPFTKRPQSWFGWEAGAAVDGKCYHGGRAPKEGIPMALGQKYTAEELSRWTMCATRDGKWTTQLPNGRYDLEIVAGGLIQPTPFQISLQDEQAVIKHVETVKNAAGKFGEIADHKAAITVTGGVLAIHLKGLQTDADPHIKKSNNTSINFLRVRTAGGQ